MTKQIKNTMNPYSEYIDLLKKEIDSMLGIALAHGWKSSLVEEGARLRAKIATYSPPRVGVGVIVEREGKILLGKRKSPHGENQWGLPGGALEKETLIECAARELLEETGMKLESPIIVGFTENTFPDGQHWITFFVKGQSSDEPVNLEPHKTHEWKWVEKETIQENDLFLPLKDFVKDRSEFNSTVASRILDYRIQMKKK